MKLTAYIPSATLAYHVCPMGYNISADYEEGTFKSFNVAIHDINFSVLNMDVKGIPYLIKDLIQSLPTSIKYNEEFIKHNSSQTEHLQQCSEVQQSEDTIRLLTSLQETLKAQNTKPINWELPLFEQSSVHTVPLSAVVHEENTFDSDIKSCDSFKSHGLKREDVYNRMRYHVSCTDSDYQDGKLKSFRVKLEHVPLQILAKDVGAIPELKTDILYSIDDQIIDLNWNLHLHHKSPHANQQYIHNTEEKIQFLKDVKASLEVGDVDIDWKLFIEYSGRHTAPLSAVTHHLDLSSKNPDSNHFEESESNMET